MGNGERDNALKLKETFSLNERINDYSIKAPLYRSPVDLCVCGTMTRAEHGCLCAEGNAHEAALCVLVDDRESFNRNVDALVEAQKNAHETVLQEADRITDHPRGKTYGPPYDDFSKVTGMALALWGRGPESPEEHAIYMIFVKLARLEATPGHHDSIVDIAGYAKAYSMVIEEKVRRLTAPSV